MDTDHTKRQEKDDEWLIKAFIYHAERLFEQDTVKASLDFFPHATEEEIIALDKLSEVTVKSGTKIKEPLTKEELLHLADAFAAIAGRAHQEEWLKKALPMKTKDAGFSLRMM